MRRTKAVTRVSNPALAVAGLLLLGCGSDETGLDEPTNAAASRGPDAPSQDEIEMMPEDEVIGPMPQPELLGGQSGVEGGCAIASIVENVALDQSVDGLSFTPADVLAYAAGAHATRLRWATFDPPGDGPTRTDALSVELEYLGPSRARLGCGGLLELPMSYRMHSEGGALQLEGNATLQATAQISYLDVQIPGESLPDWLSAATSVLKVGGDTDFVLELRLSAQGMSGSFAVRADGVKNTGGVCRLAAWPLDPAEGATPPFGVDDAQRGARVAELLASIDALEIADLGFSDGVTTSLTVAPASTPHGAYLGLGIDANGLPRPVDVYHAPLALRLTTSDGRLDVRLPGVASAVLSQDGEWGPVRLYTDSPVVAPTSGFGHVDVAGVSRRAVLDFSAARVNGSLHLSSFQPRSPELRDVMNPGCVDLGLSEFGHDFAGTSTPVTRAEWP
jgi:hypothetical protein